MTTNKMAEQPGAKEQLLPKKGTTTSIIWNWFGFTASDEGQTTPRCKICQKAVVVACSSTTNLFQHLKRKHAPEWEKCRLLRRENQSSTSSTDSTQAVKQRTLEQSFSRGVPYEKSGARWKAITEAITFYIATDMLPVYSVEKRGFNHMLSVLDARYTVPSRKYFSDVALPQLYNTTRQKINRELKDIDFYAATTDLWSSRTMQPYMCLTVHYINESWNLRSVCLQTSYFPEDHTGDTIGQELKDALNSWGLSEERLTCMTTDSGTNVIKAMKDNNWPNLKCFGHRLHNAIVNGVKDERIDRAIGVCKKAVSAFSYSWKKRRDMAEVQAELGLPPHQLVTESLTRWGSRQKMIDRFLEQEKAIVRVLGADKKSRHLVPTWQDLEVLEATNKAVKPLQDFTDALSGEAYVSVSYIKPVLHLFRTSLLQPQEEDVALTATIKRNIMSYLDKKYSDPENDELLDMASLMDPRFRSTYIDPSKLDLIKKRAVTELSALYSQNSSETSVCENQRSDSPPKKKTLAAFFKKAVPTSLPHQTESDKIEAELNSYLLSPVVDPDTDPLEWWRQHQPNFTRLSRLARKYLAIPATSAPSERVFSVGGGIVTCHRACLKPAVVDRLIFLAKNV
ncbi:E3 SUMO-protein ligase ZBED1-like [Acanthochromis polyacanthus]|uniref:E3 SUMO-protein ligase ZBED1-like n=1 Tax=Acanthochromis polyacanthus TaxID=80966 RepID=UPI000B903FAA|nr:E3 SUMO-protein ligase ZBED1-like [Acanthochromis polyacanthus]XP_022074871.1 E3 SUMO-protein ligase ZBED1-like [Acanthochromis polyacanthus]